MKDDVVLLHEENEDEKYIFEIIKRQDHPHELFLHLDIYTSIFNAKPTWCDRKIIFIEEIVNAYCANEIIRMRIRQMDNDCVIKISDKIIKKVIKTIKKEIDKNV